MSAYEEEEYYHGLLPREDLPHLLTTPGDFLLRISQPKITEPRQIIISVAVAVNMVRLPTGPNPYLTQMTTVTPAPVTDRSAVMSTTTRPMSAVSAVSHPQSTLSRPHSTMSRPHSTMSRVTPPSPRSGGRSFMDNVKWISPFSRETRVKSFASPTSVPITEPKQSVMIQKLPHDMNSPDEEDTDSAVTGDTQAEVSDEGVQKRAESNDRKKNKSIRQLFSRERRPNNSPERRNSREEMSIAGREKRFMGREKIDRKKRKPPAQDTATPGLAPGASLYPSKVAHAASPHPPGGQPSPIDPTTVPDGPTYVVQKHFIVQLRGDPAKYSIDGSLCFDSITDMITEYKNKQIPLNKDQPNTIIHNPIKRAPWELRHENITLHQKLGQGAFGDVMAGKLRLINTEKEADVAVKLAKTEDMNKEKIKEVMKEARLMRNYDHPNVVKLYGVAVEKEPLMIVMELINGGGLDDYLRKNKETTLEEKLNMVVGAAWGIEYLHFKNCIHRDLAARNCLYATVNDHKIVKISDFGLSREGEKYSMTQTRMVPIKWLAPETITTLTYTPKSDVWSFGVLVWEVYANGEDPYPGMTNGETKSKVLAGYRLAFPHETPPELNELVTKECWDHYAERRSVMSQISTKLEELSGLTPPAQQGSIRTKVREPLAPPPVRDEGGAPAYPVPGSVPSNANLTVQQDPRMSKNRGKRVVTGNKDSKTLAGKTNRIKRNPPPKKKH